MVVAPILEKEDRTREKHLELLRQQGFSRVLTKRGPVLIDELLEKNQTAEVNESHLQIVIDRMSVSAAKEEMSRLADSLEIAFFEGNGECNVLIQQKKCGHLTIDLTVMGSHSLSRVQIYSHLTVL